LTVERWLMDGQVGTQAVVRCWTDFAHRCTDCEQASSSAEE